MAGGVTDTDRGFEELQRALVKLAGESPVGVLVGVSGKTHSEEVIKAATNEFGTQKAGPNRNIVIPERSFLRSTVDEGQKEILDDLQDVVDKTIDGADLDTGLGRLGAKWVGRVQTKIKTGPFEANAQSTIDRKVAKFGQKGTPLIAEGRMRQSITWQIERGS